jgi:hypothetical protein
MYIRHRVGNLQNPGIAAPPEWWIR